MTVRVHLQSETDSWLLVRGNRNVYVRRVLRGLHHGSRNMGQEEEQYNYREFRTIMSKTKNKAWEVTLEQRKICESMKVLIEITLTTRPIDYNYL